MPDNIILFVFYCSLIMIAVIIAYIRKTPWERAGRDLCRASIKAGKACSELSETFKKLQNG